MSKHITYRVVVVVFVWVFCFVFVFVFVCLFVICMGFFLVFWLVGFFFNLRLYGKGPLRQQDRKPTVDTSRATHSD